MPTVYKPTRITVTTSTCIDNILTNNQNIVQSTILVTDGSDHFITTLSANIDLNHKNNRHIKFVYKRKHGESNFKKLKDTLGNIKMNEILNNNDVNYDYDKFIEMFTKTYDDCIPLKKCTIKRKKIHY